MYLFGKILIVMFMNDYFDKCKICPRNCLVDRNNYEIGFCKSGNKIRVAKAYLHMWEEPCISGYKKKGTVWERRA